MAARLTRARKALAGERFAVPSGAELDDRVATVAEVAYLAFTAGYAPGSGPDVLRADLAGEAIRLVRVLRAVLPAGSPARADLDALLALMLLQHSRRDARVARRPAGAAAGPGPVAVAARRDRRGAGPAHAARSTRRSTPYLLQALIAAEHAIAPTAADDGLAPDRRLVRRARGAHRVAGGPAQPGGRRRRGRRARSPGSRLLDGLELPGHRLPGVRAELLARAGRPEEARAPYELAIERCGNEAERAHLRSASTACNELRRSGVRCQGRHRRRRERRTPAAPSSSSGSGIGRCSRYPCARTCWSSAQIRSSCDWRSIPSTTTSSRGSEPSGSPSAAGPRRDRRSRCPWSGSHRP